MGSEGGQDSETSMSREIDERLDAATARVASGLTAIHDLMVSCHPHTFDGDDVWRRWLYLSAAASTLEAACFSLSIARKAPSRGETMTKRQSAVQLGKLTVPEFGELANSILDAFERGEDTVPTALAMRLLSHHEAMLKEDVAREKHRQSGVSAQ